MSVVLRRNSVSVIDGSVLHNEGLFTGLSTAKTEEKLQSKGRQL